jgi:hypothetical protein
MYALIKLTFQHQSRGAIVVSDGEIVIGYDCVSISAIDQSPLVPQLG